LRGRTDLSVRGTVRDLSALPDSYAKALGPALTDGVDVTNPAAREEFISDSDVVINAVGVIKQAAGLEDRVATVKVNALLPQQLAIECETAGVRLIQVSTDCVFSGRRGSYSECDVPDPVDFYGRSKLLGEVGGPALTLRTSIIGHEVQRHASLVDWFLTHPQTRVRGFVNAIYSGVTTNEFATLLADVILPRADLTGIYHVASASISKAELLSLLAEEYGWQGTIEAYEQFRCDRSMRADRLADATGYRPPSWREMVRRMYETRPVWAVSQSDSGAQR